MKKPTKFEKNILSRNHVDIEKYKTKYEHKYLIRCNKCGDMISITPGIDKYGFFCKKCTLKSAEESADAQTVSEEEPEEEPFDFHLYLKRILINSL